jgi:hypothetical protein
LKPARFIQLLPTGYGHALALDSRFPAGHMERERKRKLAAEEKLRAKADAARNEAWRLLVVKVGKGHGVRIRSTHGSYPPKWATVDGANNSIYVWSNRRCVGQQSALYETCTTTDHFNNRYELVGKSA